MNDAVNIPLLKNILRTPDTRFENLPDYPFKPNYMNLNGLRMHYVDEGPTDANPILLLHGEPSWSFLYRKMISLLAKENHRVIAPDFIGFGKSDKPARQKDYSYQKHIAMLNQFLTTLDLKNITLFCQDWGGLIGLRSVAAHSDRFDRVIVSNTGLPALKGLNARLATTKLKIDLRRQGKVSTIDDLFQDFSFLRWIKFAKSATDFPVAHMINLGTTTKLSTEILAGYDAPYPDESYKAGAHVFPSLLSTQFRQNRKVWKEVFFNWKKPFLTAFSDKDPITRGQDTYFQQKIPGAQSQAHVTIKDGGHFVQEDKPEELSELILNFVS